MNWLDILLILAAAVSFFAGLSKGFVRSAIGLVAFTAGVVCGLWFYGSAGMYFSSFLGKKLADVAGFCVILIAFMLAGGILAAILAKLLKFVHLSWLDRLAGGAFGIVRGVLFCAMIVMLITAFSSKQPPASITDSRTAHYFIRGSNVIAAAAPHDVREAFESGYAKIKKFWNDVAKKTERKPEERD